MVWNFKILIPPNGDSWNALLVSEAGESNPVSDWRCQVISLRPSDDYMYHLLYQSVTLHFVFMGLV
jgi:hypothetical protein